MGGGGTVSRDAVMDQEFGIMFGYEIREYLFRILNVDLEVVGQPFIRYQFVFIEYEMFQLIQNRLVGSHLGFGC